MVGRYREAAQRGEWEACERIARELYRLGPPKRDEAETLYAVGYAVEKQGRTSEARAYFELLSVNHNHAKARRRLRAAATPLV